MDEKMINDNMYHNDAHRYIVEGSNLLLELDVRGICDWDKGLILQAAIGFLLATNELHDNEGNKGSIDEKLEIVKRSLRSFVEFYESAFDTMRNNGEE